MLQPASQLSADTRILLNHDDPSPVPSCNRPALEVMTLRRESEKRDVSLALSDAWEMADACAQREHELTAQIERNDWWTRYAPMVLFLSFGVGAAIGGWIGSGVQRTIDHR